MGKVKSGSAKATKRFERRKEMLVKGELMNKKIRKRPRKKRTFNMKDLKDALQEVSEKPRPQMSQKKHLAQRNEVLKRERERLKTFLKERNISQGADNARASAPF